MSTMLVIYSWLRLLKITVSSIRFKNSGLKWFRKVSLTIISRCSFVSEASPIALEPKFEIMIRTVFLKSTVRPIYCTTLIGTRLDLTVLLPNPFVFAPQHQISELESTPHPWLLLTEKLVYWLKCGKSNGVAESTFVPLPKR